MIEGKSKQQTQVRLILPLDWVKELDVIAKSRFISRLALIRHYLRIQLDKDLENLRDQLAIINDNKFAVAHLEKIQEQGAQRRKQWEE